MTDSQIQNFLDQCTVIKCTNEGGIDLTALFGVYVSWCLTGGTAPMANSAFVTAIRHHGIEHDDDQGAIRFYPGLTMVDSFSTREVPDRTHAEAQVPGAPNLGVLPA